MKIHPTAEEIRVTLKKTDIKVNFFEVEDKRNSKSRTYRVGYKDTKLHLDDVIKIINEHVDVFNISHDEYKVDFSVKDFDGRKNDKEYVELLASLEYETEDQCQENVGELMRNLIIDFAKDIKDMGVDTKAKLDDIVEIYNKKYNSIHGIVFSEEFGNDYPHIRLKLAGILETDMFRIYYANLVLPSLRETWPHWNL